jgi:hypothetical protein
MRGETKFEFIVDSRVDFICYSESQRDSYIDYLNFKGRKFLILKTGNN